MVGADHDFGFSNEFLSCDPFHMAIQVAFVGTLRFVALAIEVVRTPHEGIGISRSPPILPIEFPVDVCPEHFVVRIITIFQSKNGNSFLENGLVRIITLVLIVGLVTDPVNVSEHRFSAPWPVPEIISSPLGVGWAIERTAWHRILLVIGVSKDNGILMWVDIVCWLEPPTEIIGIHQNRIGQLSQIVDAGGSLCFLLCLGKSREQHACQNGDDGDDHQ